MRKLTFCVIVGSLCVLCLGTEAGALAGVISPEVQEEMHARGAQGEISVIVRMAGEADVTPFRGLPRGERRAKMVRTLKGKAEEVQLPVRSLLQGRRARNVESLWLINGMMVTAPPEVIRELARLPEVTEIRLDRSIPLGKVTYESTTVAEWGVDAIRAPQVWNRGYSGKGVVVANMDTGVDLEHPDLKDRWRGGANSWYDPYRRHTRPKDVDGHGTMSMGAIVGGAAGGSAIGVAPGARWIAVKIFDDDGRASTGAIHLGFQWLLDPDKNPDTDDAPDVVNNSWGFESPDTCDIDFEKDIKTLEDAGIAVVFAAGNDGPSPSTSSGPGNNTGVFSVGATDSGSLVASFSSRGPSTCDGAIFPLVCAPGKSIKLATLSHGGSPSSYTIASGTSFASPLVAGAMALLLSAYPGLAVHDLYDALVSTSRDLGDSGPDNDYGYGLINVAAAHEAIQGATVAVNRVSQPEADGWILESTAGSQIGNKLNTTRHLKTILSFNTSGIPDGAVVTSATIFLTRGKIVGTDPFDTHGTCFVDLAAGGIDPQGIDTSDFKKAAGDIAKVAVLTKTSRDGQQSKGILVEEGLRAINKTGVTQFRVYLSSATDRDRATDQIIFQGDDAPNAQHPKLRITYRKP